MVAWVPVIRTAMKVAPFALEIARQADRQLRPHVLAYRMAREVDGYVASWTSGDGGHWIVFARPNAEPLRAFPPLPVGELELVGRELDRATLRHHSDLPEAKFRDRTAKVVNGPIRIVTKHRGDDPPPPPIQLPPPPR